MSLVEFWLITSEKEGKGMSSVLRTGMEFYIDRRKKEKKKRREPEYATPTGLSYGRMT